MTSARASKFLSVKDKLIESWTQRFKERRTDLHVSDCLNCLRQSCFKRLDENPKPISLKTVHHIHNGTMRHRELQEILGDEFECEKSHTWIGPNTGVKLVFTPDAVWKKDGAVVEIKTTESTRVLPEKEGPYHHHILQAKIYTALLGAPYAKLIYCIAGYYPEVKDYFPEYLITFKDGECERQEVLDKLERDAAELQRGIDKKNPGLVSHIAKNPEYINKWNYNWMCSNCDYRALCDQYRRDAGEFRIQTLNALSRKSIAMTHNNITVTGR